MEQILWEFLVQHEFYHDSHQISLWIWLHLNVFICQVADMATDCCSLCHSCWPRCSVLSPAPSSRTHARLLDGPLSCVCITSTRPSADTGMITLMATSNNPPRNTMIAPESTTDHIFRWNCLRSMTLVDNSKLYSDAALSCWQPHGFQTDLRVWLRAQFFNSCVILISMCCAVVIKSVALPLTWTLSWTAVKCRSTLRSRKATFRVPPNRKQN